MELQKAPNGPDAQRFSLDGNIMGGAGSYEWFVVSRYDFVQGEETVIEPRPYAWIIDGRPIHPEWTRLAVTSDGATFQIDAG